MARHNPKKITFEDTFDNILYGNDSELEYLSSGYESKEYVEYNDYGGDIVNSDTEHTDSDSISDDNSSSENGGSANPRSQSKGKKTFRWRKRDMMPADSTRMSK